MPGILFRCVKDDDDAILDIRIADKYYVNKAFKQQFWTGDYSLDDSGVGPLHMAPRIRFLGMDWHCGSLHGHTPFKSITTNKYTPGFNNGICTGLFGSWAEFDKTMFLTLIRRT